MSANSPYLFCINMDLLPIIKIASDDDLIQVFRAQFATALGDDIPELDGLAKAIFDSQVGVTDRIAATRAKRSEAGRKGGNPALKKTSAEDETQDNHSLTEDNQCLTEVKPIPYHTNTIPDLTRPYQTGTKPKNNLLSDKSHKIDEIDVFFDSVWDLYPKKQGKQKVSKKSRHALFKLGYDVIAQAIERYAEDCRINNRADQYIMHGSTFFNSGYEDFLDNPSKSPADAYDPDLDDEERPDY